MPLLPHALRTTIAIMAMGGAVRAQQANFTASTTGGCSPLTVSFTNTTTGASGSATYSWDFGNGNKTATGDINASIGATYTTQQAYTVTLTVTDGAKTSTKTLTVTVYKNPTVAFTESGGKGCVPDPVTFTSSSTAGDGTISQYFWDFGDGNTKSATTTTVSNTYQYAGSPTVGLTVTNSHGCSATLTQPNLFTIYPAVVPAFAAGSPTLCQLTDPELFTNTTTGPPTLSYLWRFGDGTTSTDPAPSHTYATKGIYNVTLVATSSVGCVDSLVKTQYVDAANFNPSFTVNNPTLCSGVELLFSDNSNPAPNSYSENWSFGDNTGSGYGGNVIDHTYTAGGTYTVTMNATYGQCPVTTTKQISVFPAPTLGGFQMTTTGLCGAPVTVQLTDTSKAAVSRAWSEDPYYGYLGPTTPFATTPTASYTFASNGDMGIWLTITDANGCTASVERPVPVEPPQVYINVLSTDPSGTYSCNPVTVNVSAQSDVRLTKYNWNFGDGTTSTDSLPTHTYTQPGSYTITLQYTNANGCTGSQTTYGFAVQIAQRPVAKFSISPANPICGDNPVTFTSQATNAYNVTWDFGDGEGNAYVYGSQYVHQYTKEGTYTITMIAIGFNAFCTDTLVKVDSVVVLPAFPKIETSFSTCNGDRGDITLVDSIRGATSATWNFGDGTTQPAVSDTIVHDYAKSGIYKVVLITVAGQCTNRDSTTVYVLKKQHPILKSPVDSICGSGPLTLTISGLDTNYYYYNQYYWNYYGVAAWQYEDGSAIPQYSYPSYSGPDVNVQGTTTTYTATWTNLTPGHDSIRVFLQSNGQYQDCIDTSNYVKVKIKGPIAGLVDSGSCWKNPYLFRDTSRGTDGVPITQWVWTFGDGTTQTAATGADVYHTYGQPGNNYDAYLTVTDAQGCTDRTIDNYVYPEGPKANFTWSPTNISPGTTAIFSNTSFGPYYSALWTFASDKSTSNNIYQVSHTYPNITNDTVTLVVTNSTYPQIGCNADTITQVIQVRNVNAAFTFTTSYVNNNNCPPVVVYFKSTSYNVTGYQWDFGDGATAQGNPNPSHTYNKPGKYYISLTATGAGQTVITVTDSVTVKGPYASVSADVPQACSPSKVTLTAVAVGAVSYTWDFGDGTVLSAADTFATHTYTVPGIYNPALILKDALGCASTFNPSVPVVVDSLKAQARAAVSHLCDSGSTAFSAPLYSLSNGALGEALRYHWDFGTGNPADTSDAANPSWTYTALGAYTVHLTVTSTPGCVSASTESIQVTATAHGSIAGPPEGCVNDSLHFTAAALRGAPTWQWLFPGGVTDTSAKPAIKAASSGAVELISTWNGCADTATAALTVHALPVIDITPDAPRICQGASITLTAHDGQVYQWKGLASDPALTVAPASPTTYYVTVTNTFGCVNTDSVYVFVARPFQVRLPADTTLCIGDSMYLQAAGAYAYQWSTGATANPLLVDPAVSTTYTVTGTDQDRCFSSTATTSVQVVPRPTVRATPVGIVIAGASVNLQATGSPDIATWLWTPPDYLDCASCQNPVSTPQSNILYTVTGETAYGCTASDTVRIRLICMQDRVAIPGAFSPNHDGYNDLFYPRGSGVRVITGFLIYSRWGTLVFERHNIPLNDPSTAWDGTFAGADQPVGAYVYELTLICDTGETFTRKGTVLLER
ncbi:MAG TPA: PKD domain-containing protein [Dinghuibacter sp.]|uniref:PKD domain-containing protein n=1 Tax=Dinghuibacter sp. TaxID=2024697 RepID=UPI002BD04B23|nr:PKD domain-containing protein [Dinghuibacter sp.]HTJ14320.1 PKD domain-containing protein [Dinghuibacter sp.]